MFKTNPIPFAFTGVDLKSAPDCLAQGKCRRALNVRPATEYGLRPRQGTFTFNSNPLASTNVHTVRYLYSPNVGLGGGLNWVGAGKNIYDLYTQVQLDSLYSGNPLTSVDYRLGGTGVPYAIIGDFLKMTKLQVDQVLGGVVSGLGIWGDTGAALPSVLPLFQTTVNSMLSAASLTGVSMADQGAQSIGSTGSVRAANVVTYTASGSHNLVPGVPVNILANADNSFNGQYFVQTVPSAATFTYACIGANGSTSGGTAYFGEKYKVNSSATAVLEQNVGTPSTWNLDLLPGNIVSTDEDSIYLWVYIDQPSYITQFLLNFFLGSPVTGVYTADVTTQISQTASSWTQVKIAKGDFARSGTIGNLDWASVTTWSIEVITNGSGTPYVTFDNLCLAGRGADASVGVTYDYRETNYNPTTLSESNPSPVETAANYVSPFGQPVGLIPGMLAWQNVGRGVTQQRWWRRGGSLPDEWQLVGTQDATPAILPVIVASPHGLQIVAYGSGNAIELTTSAPHGITSASSAVYIAGATDSRYDGFWPILQISSPTIILLALLQLPIGEAASGGGTVQPALIDINLDAEIASEQSLSLFNDVPVTTVNISGVPVYGQPLPFIWGPYSGTTIFGCGDPNMPGYAYWCNPSNPDAWSSINNIEVTQPSDPLQNGFFWNGASYVFSLEKLFQLQPTPVGGSLLTYFPVDMVVGAGLFARWGLCASPHTPAVWFVGRDGIYEWAGGPASLISNELWPLFHQATVEGNAPIDFSQEAKIKLAYFDGELRFVFQDTNGASQVWICDIGNGHRWRQANYPWKVSDLYAQPGEVILPTLPNVFLYGGADGNVYQESETATSDGSTTVPQPIACDIRTLSWNAGDSRAQKEFGDCGIDLDAQGVSVTATPGFNFYTNVLGGKVFNQAGRATGQVDFNSGAGQLATTVTLDIAWSSATATPVIYGWSPSLSIKPEDTILRFTDPEDAGYMGAKHIRGLILEADTSNVLRSIQIQADTGAAGAFQNQNTPLNVQHNGQSEQVYAFVPFTAHNLRLAPTDANPWRLYRWRWLFDEYPENAALYGAWSNDGFPGAKFVQGMVLEGDSLGQNVTLQIQGDTGTVLETLTVNHNGRSEIAYPLAAGDWVPFVTHNLRIVPQTAIQIFGVRWIWTKLPELATRWRTMVTTNGLHGWQSVFFGYIAHISTADLTFTITPDTGSPIVVTVPNSGGVFAKTLVQFPTNKFKSCQWELTSAQPARVFLKDLEIRMRQWDGDDVMRKPFGEVTQDGAAI